MTVMAELLLPLKGGCSNIHKRGVSFEIRITIQRLAGKFEKTIEVFEIIEYDTHQKVILWRSRVGDGLRPKFCTYVLHYCRRVVLEFPGVLLA